jgi:hypothetical protein
MDGNDTLGDCTIAALAHAVTTYRGLLGSKTIMTKPAVVKPYMHLTGGVDSGLNELDVLNYWRKTAVSGDKILGYASIDPKNHTHVQQAIQIFGGVYIGFQAAKLYPGVRCPPTLDAWPADDGRPRGLCRWVRPERRDRADLGKYTAGNLGLVG